MFALEVEMSGRELTRVQVPSALSEPKQKPTETDKQTSKPTNPNPEGTLFDKKNN